MPWAVKVVARVRRPGQSAAQLRDRLVTAEGALSADVTAALLPLEPEATVRWSMRAFPQGGNEYEVYPKLVVTLPRWEATPRPADPSAIYAALRVCRDALVSRLTQLAAQFNWTIVQMYTKSYDG